MGKRKKFTEVQKRLLACKQHYMCVGEGCKNMQLLPCTWELDHITPLCQQGTNNYENLQIICPNCHALKTQGELMAAAKKLRETKQILLHQRIRLLKQGMRQKHRKDQHMSPYFNNRHHKFLSEFRPVYTKMEVYALSRHDVHKPESVT
jgi:hypothetical protein